MREVFAVIGWIVAFAAVYFLLGALANCLGLPTYIDYGEAISVMRGSGREAYEEETSGNMTDVGIYMILASAMLAWRVYRWILTGKGGGGLKPAQSITWKYWFLGATAYIVITSPIWLLGIPGSIQRPLVLAVGAGILWFAYDRCTTELFTLSRRDREAGS